MSIRRVGTALANVTLLQCGLPGIGKSCKIAVKQNGPRVVESRSTIALRSRFMLIKKVAKSLRRHRPLILNWLLALGGISTGVFEGFNGKAKLTNRTAYGLRTPQGIGFALFHVMGNLPEPKFTHRLR